MKNLETPFQSSSSTSSSKMWQSTVDHGLTKVEICNLECIDHDLMFGKNSLILFTCYFGRFIDENFRLLLNGSMSLRNLGSKPLAHLIQRRMKEPDLRQFKVLGHHGDFQRTWMKGLRIPGDYFNQSSVTVSYLMCCGNVSMMETT